MKYTVKATYASLHTVDVEADNADQAYQKAKELELSQFEQVKNSGVLEIIEAELADSNFTEEQQAFMKAYHSNVGSAPSDVVKAFILSESHDEFCREHGNEYYSGLADAIGVWDDALAYARRSK